LIRYSTYSKPIKYLKVLFLYTQIYFGACTAYRLQNLLHLKLSFFYSKLFKKARIKGYPTAISVEPINICNLSCPECPTGLKIIKRNKGTISSELYQEIVNNISKHTFMVNLYFQGEPFMHVNLFELIKYAKSKRLIVSTSTNGLFITESIADKIVESGLDEIFISLDGITQEVYEKYRIGGEVDKVISGITNLVDAKRRRKSNFPVIRTQMLAFSFNEHQISEFKKLSYKLGVDVADVKTAQIYDVENKRHLLPSGSRLTRYSADQFNVNQIKGKIKNSCWKHWMSCVITWDGEVVPCCFDKDAQFSMGNSSSLGVNKIWKNDHYTNFRNLVLMKQSVIEICKNCPLSRT